MLYEITTDNTAVSTTVYETTTGDATSHDSLHGGSPGITTPYLETTTPYITTSHAPTPASATGDGEVHSSTQITMFTGNSLEDITPSNSLPRNTDIIFRPDITTNLGDISTENPNPTTMFSRSSTKSIELTIFSVGSTTSVSHKTSGADNSDSMPDKPQLASTRRVILTSTVGEIMSTSDTVAEEFDTSTLPSTVTYSEDFTDISSEYMESSTSFIRPVPSTQSDDGKTSAEREFRFTSTTVALSDEPISTGSCSHNFSNFCVLA